MTRVPLEVPKETAVEEWEVCSAARRRVQGFGVHCEDGGFSVDIKRR